ncbi:MAG: ABC transporter transmembrane domain-containing protein [Bacteroidota bacterium]
MAKDQEKEQLPKLNRENLKEALKIFKYVYPYRWAFFGGLFLIFVSRAVFMVFPYLSGLMVDIAQGEAEAGLTLNQVGIYLVIILVIQSFVSYVRILLFAYSSEKGIGDLRKGLYQKIISLPIFFFENNRSGDLLSRITADVGKLYSAFSVTLAEFLGQVFILIGGIIFLAFRAPELSLIMLLTLPVVLVGAMFFGRFIRKMSKERQEELASSNIILSETIEGIRVVKAFTNELFESLRYGKSINSVVKISLRYANYRALFASFIVIFIFGALFFIIWQGALMLQNGTMTAGRLIEFISYTAIIGGSIASLGNFYTEIIGALGATERIREIMGEDSEVEIEEEQEIVSIPLQGQIEYKNVHFSYPTRNDVPVLKGINFEVPIGKKVALVGTSGSGKSTIVQLLLKYYNLDSGQILVDGKNISDLNPLAYRENIAIVPQEVMLFGGTIQENIAYGKSNATEAEIIEAAKKANAYDFISSFPEGFETIVGERGIKLSGGQRQRVAIARAILKDPAILLLDEATSSLDAESEKVVQDALNVLMEGRTSIIIAHRLSTIRDVDQIYVLEDGKIIEEGTHLELSMLENGAYNNLAKLQFDLVES